MKRFACIALLVLLSLVCVAQGPDEQAAMLIKQAKEQCDKRQWNKALNTLSGIDDPKSIMKPSREQKAAIDSLRQVCRRGKAEDNILEVRDNGSISVPYSESIRAAELRFNKEPYIVSAPFWCKAVIDGKSLVISIEENPVRTPRNGTVKLALKSNKNSTCSVSITQEARPQTVKTVVVTTTPDNALLTIENVQLYTPATFTLEQGPHTILIRKGGFSQVTKNINIPDDLKRDTLRLSFSLSSSFAYLHPEVVSEIDGSPLNSAAIEIDGYRIPSEEARLEGAEDNIRNFVRYNGGIIPVPFGSKPLKVRVSADRYETWEGSVDVPKGRTGLIPMQTIVLKPVLGNCKFVGNEDAYGATVFLNDKPVGVVDGSNISVQEGKYSVRIEKDGYMVTSDDGPAITVESGRDKRYNVSMARYGKYFITSDEPGAWVEIDDVRVANLPMSDTLKIPVGAGHKLNIGKNGYQTVRYTLDVEPGSYVMSVGLRKVYPLTIDAYKYKYKKASYGLWEKKAEGAELVYTLTPEVTLDLPYGDYILIEGEKKPSDIGVYRHRFSFKAKEGEDEGTVRRKRFLSEPDAYFSIFDANLYLLGQKPYFSDIADCKEYSQIGHLAFGTFSPFAKGLQTSIAKAAIFMYPTPEKGSMKELGESILNEERLLPAFSLLMINQEFRAGVPIFEHANAEALLGYTWYPTMPSFFKFSHVSGHEIFAGAEIGSRIRFANLSLRTGLQLFMGQANFYRPNNNLYKDTKFYYVEPMRQAQFVVSLGISLGGGEHRGHSVLWLM